MTWRVGILLREVIYRQAISNKECDSGRPKITGTILLLIQNKVTNYRTGPFWRFDYAERVGGAEQMLRTNCLAAGPILNFSAPFLLLPLEYTNEERSLIIEAIMSLVSVVTSFDSYRLNPQILGWCQKSL